MKRQWKIEGAGCLCVASLGFVCGLCREAEMLAPAQAGVSEKKSRTSLDLTGYGYIRGDAEGYAERTVCSPEEHYEGTFLTALEELLDATRL